MISFKNIEIRLLNKIRFLKYFNLKKVINIDNKKFIIPIFNSIGLDMVQFTRDWMSDV